VPFDGISDKAADPAMISIAEKIIEQQEGPFDPSQFVDRYEEALRALIEDKKKGHKPAKVAEPEDTNVVDLMSALRASLSGKDKGGNKDASKPKAKAAAPKAKARKAS
jgi:DNA end-binding protein Ku